MQQPTAMTISNIIFCEHVNDIITSHVPTKQSNSRHTVPWLTTELRCMCRKKQRLYNRAKKSRKEHHWSTYKSHKKSTAKALNKARIDYINGILQAGLDEGNPKPFSRYIFSQRNGRGGVAALKEDGKLHTGGQKKAEILNKQFISVFSVDEPGSDTVLSGPSYPPIDMLLISVQGVEKLLTGINPNKAAGPDQVPCCILKGALYNPSTSVSSHIHPITRDWHTAIGMEDSIRLTHLQEGRHLPSRKLPPCQLDVCNMQDAWTHHLPPCEKPPGQAWHLVSTATWVQIRAFMWNTASYHHVWPAVYKAFWLSDWRHCAWL